MKVEKVSELWRDGVKSAVFTARKGPDIGHSPSVVLYPLRDGSGYLWAVWHNPKADHGGVMVVSISKAIRKGGRTARSFERACKLAVHELLIYKGRRPNER